MILVCKSYFASILWSRYSIIFTVEIVLLMENSKLLNLFKPLLTMHYNDDLSATGETESWQKVKHLQSAQEIDKGSEKPMPFRRLARWGQSLITHFICYYAVSLQSINSLNNFLVNSPKSIEPIYPYEIRIERIGHFVFLKFNIKIYYG